jgi:hypothetical protein
MVQERKEPMSSPQNNNNDFIAISIGSPSYPPGASYSAIYVVVILYYWMRKKKNGFVPAAISATIQTKERR